MGITSLNFDDWIEWYGTISRPETLMQLGAIALAGVLALLLTHVGRRLFLGKASEEDRHLSVIFGRRDFDGVLFPALWLLLANVAPYVLDVPLRYSLFRVALPVLVALVLIRLGAKILRAAFHEARWVRTLERRGSWMIWLGMVLWVSGILPVFLEQLEGISFKLGSSQFDARSLLEGALMVGVTLLLALWLSALVERQLMRNATGSRLSLRKILSNVLRWMSLQKSCATLQNPRLFKPSARFVLPLSTRAYRRLITGAGVLFPLSSACRISRSPMSSNLLAPVRQSMLRCKAGNSGKLCSGNPIIWCSPSILPHTAG